MTLIVLEGPSRSGKSTVRDALQEKHPEWIMWKGENLMRKGVGSEWVDYRERYHEALHRLYELNPENVIIADRGFTDCVYNSDAEMRNEFKRLAACYGDVIILYFYPGEIEHTDRPVHDTHGKEVLRERGTRDAHCLDALLKRYAGLLQMFEWRHVNTDKADVERATEIAELEIESFHGGNQHDPDV